MSYPRKQNEWNVTNFSQESECFTDIELAQSKPARQSSTYGNHAASMAVDGNTATYSMAAVGGTSSDIAWWQVDLGEIYKITRMTIVNSNDGNGDYIKNLW